MSFRQSDIAHFRKGEVENPRFWSRLGHAPDLSGATTLDVGCGWGSLCVDMALAGASKVVGLDIKPELIEFASAYVTACHPQLANVVEFEAVDLRDYRAMEFDYIVSKDAFEHIIDLRSVFAEMEKRLKRTGRLYAGFGPIYASPYGDHDRRRVAFRSWGVGGRLLASIPWGHLFMEDLIVRMQNRRQHARASSMRDLGLNTWSVSDYRRLFLESGLSLLEYRVNQSKHPLSRLLSVLRRVPFLADYCTFNVYCVLEKV